MVDFCVLYPLSVFSGTDGTAPQYFEDHPTNRGIVVPCDRKSPIQWDSPITG